MIGSGPAGLAAAAELNQSGHSVTVYERDEGPGGLLRFGVPDAKLEKWIIDRRVSILQEEGIEFAFNTDVGTDITAEELQERLPRGRGRDRLTDPARARRAQPRAGRDPSGDGLPVSAQPLGRRQPGTAVS